MTAKTITRRALMIIVGGAALAHSLKVQAANAPIKRFSQSGEADEALVGYDSTAYFSRQKAERGTTDHVVAWKGATWRFASAADASLFEADPEAYAPQFGGYCTRAMSLGTVAPANSEVWRIHNGKLHVFFAARGGVFFDENPDDMVAKAQTFWDSLEKIE